MNANKFSKIIAAGMMVVTPLLWTSCSDTWGEHYDVTEGGMAGQSSLLANIAADPSLANFYRVIEAIGASQTLDSPQQFTIWAPVNFTEAQADSVIAIFQEDSIAGLKLEDNRAMTQFLQNHMSLYALPISSLTDDTVAMLNNKYMHLIGKSSTTGTLQGNSFDGAVVCNNGILYKMDKLQTFFPNIREYMKIDGRLDSIMKFITSFDEYELDENASVAGGVVDGKTVYLDSVTLLRNNLLNMYGYIQREDSTYTFLAPTDEVWKTEYEKYHKFFNYDGSVSNADSLADVMTKHFIISGRFFNTSADWSYNRHPSDSLCNTMYSERQSHNPRQNVYYNPESGILSGLEKVQCSNGYVYVDDKGVIEPQTTLFGRLDLDASMPFYYEIPKNSDGTAEVLTAAMTYETFKDSASTQLKRAYPYVQVVSAQARSNSSLVYTIPNVYSGCYYNIYLVMVPNPDISNQLPVWFNMSYVEKNDKGVFPAYTSGELKYSYFDNPNPVTADNTRDGDIILNESHPERIFVSDASKVDTILLQRAMQFEYSGMTGNGINDASVKMKIVTTGKNSYREVLNTRTLRLNELILVPFETEEEALEAAENRDAFNDDLLERKKEN